MNTILVVEDDPLIGNAVEQWLGQDSRVEWVQSMSAAQIQLQSEDFDIVLLDLGLPDGHGFDLLQMIKRRKIQSGVLIMTAYGDVDDRVRGLDLGADDYLVKPIDFKELDARIRSVKRRKDGLSSTVIEVGDLEFDINAKVARRQGEAIHLSKMEVSILSILLQGQGRYYSKAMLEERLYDGIAQIEGNAIEVHISALRKKLGKSLIKTTRGLGYIVEKGYCS